MAWGDVALKNSQGRDPYFRNPRLGTGTDELVLGKGAFYRNIAEKHHSLIPIQRKIRYLFQRNTLGATSKKPSGRAGGRGKARAKCSRRRRLGYHWGCPRRPSTPAPAASQPRRRHLGPSSAAGFSNRRNPAGHTTLAKQLGRALAGLGLPSPNPVSGRPRPPSKDKVLSR